jgi:hypothetical protein
MYDFSSLTCAGVGFGGGAKEREKRRGKGLNEREDVNFIVLTDLTRYQLCALMIRIKIAERQQESCHFDYIKFPSS